MGAFYFGEDANRAYEWIKHSRIDPFEVVDAAEAWFGEAKQHVEDAFDKMGSPISQDFRRKTDLLCLWCDAETNIDPSPLQEMQWLLIGRFPARTHTPKEIPAGYEIADQRKGPAGTPQRPDVLEKGLTRSFIVITRIIDLAILKSKDLKSGETTESTGGWHESQDTPPDGWHGPLTGTKENLAQWVLPQSDAKTTRRRQLLTYLENNKIQVWGRRDTDRKCSMWFLNMKKLSEANEKMLMKTE